MSAGVYRRVLRDPATRGLLTGLAASALGDGVSAVTIAWLAVRLAPHGSLGVFVGVAVAAYSLPSALGAIAFRGSMARRSARGLVLFDCGLRAGFLGAVAVLELAGSLSPWLYVGLLAASSLMGSWGQAGTYTLLAILTPAEDRHGANSLASSQVSAATILGPAVAGALLAPVGPGWLIAVDAVSYVVLGVAALRVRLPEGAGVPRAEQTLPAGTEGTGAARRPGGERPRGMLRRHGLTGLILLSVAFFFIYGPVEDALPVYVVHHAHRDGSRLLGEYWTVFGVGALIGALWAGRRTPGNPRAVTVAIVAGWGACLLPFGFAPVGVTLACLALGGAIFGPFLPLTYSLLQSAVPTSELPSLLAARSAFTVVAAPLGTAIGGPLVGWLGPATVLVGSGAATMALAAVALGVWRDAVLRRG